MPESSYRGRAAFHVENADLRVTVTREGGHIAEILHKPSGINPLWTPPWKSLEPSAYDPRQHPEYGGDAESRLLAGILGHNLCLDLFGPPSPEEAAAGLTVHGEASVRPYEISGQAGELRLQTALPMARLRLDRRIRLDPNNRTVHIVETVENEDACDRPIAWTQHVTLGPPFLRNGSTRFAIPAVRSKVFEADFGASYMKTGAEFRWPDAPRKDGGSADLSTYNSARMSAAFSTHLMDPGREYAFFHAYSPESHLLFGYRWKRADFPWLGIWEENRSRGSAPWNGETITCGMEFGVSPMPESRRQMISRGSLFETPAFRWLPAKSRLTVEYQAFLHPSEGLPAAV